MYYTQHICIPLRVTYVLRTRIICIGRRRRIRRTATVSEIALEVIKECFGFGGRLPQVAFDLVLLYFGKIIYPVFSFRSVLYRRLQECKVYE